VVACGPGWLVVDKPCGMSIHNDPGRDLCSLALAAVQAGELPAVGRDITAVHAAHRLDRDTSGIVMLAGDPKTLAFLGGQFAQQTVHKRYLAVVHGRLQRPPENQDRVDWKWSLTAAAAGRKGPQGKGKRLPCTTRWRILAISLHYTLIECEPLTGRKHQIRRHAKLAGHPVVGDRRYGSTRSVTYLSRHHGFHRLGLHAHALTVRLPAESNTTTFHSEGMPEAMQQLIEKDI
jgi:RluA family pseudouridine synthase